MPFEKLENVIANRAALTAAVSTAKADPRVKDVRVWGNFFVTVELQNGKLVEVAKPTLKESIEFILSKVADDGK